MTAEQLKLTKGNYIKIKRPGGEILPVRFNFEMFNNYDFIPIEISEKELIDFGFVCINKISMNYKKYINEQTKDTIYVELWNGGNNPKWRINISLGFTSIAIIKSYVHELQNLFFSITGKELSKH